ncbi:SHOCT domain-containing protein [Actinoplanes sp. CA-030573]|uniref:SHOCT domain-containing protein n=1 Tax=Actinoplanes sp. CA-030573 TaxID=3239898 RepID=UPI003D93AB66
MFARRPTGPRRGAPLLRGTLAGGAGVPAGRSASRTDRQDTVPETAVEDLPSAEQGMQPPYPPATAYDIRPPYAPQRDYDGPARYETQPAYEAQPGDEVQSRYEEQPIYRPKSAAPASYPASSAGSPARTDDSGGPATGAAPFGPSGPGADAVPFGTSGPGADAAPFGTSGPGAGAAPFGTSGPGAGAAPFGPAASSATADDLNSRLERLAALYSEGVLTDEEFAAARGRLLGR